MSAAGHREDRRHRLLHVLEDVVAVAVGILTLVLPDVTALALIVLIGAWAVVAASSRWRRPSVAH